MKTLSKPLDKFFIKNKLKSTDPRQQDFLKSIVDMIAIDGLPISFVEGLGFRGLMEKIAPQYKIPCR